LRLRRLTLQLLRPAGQPVAVPRQPLGALQHGGVLAPPLAPFLGEALDVRLQPGDLLLPLAEYRLPLPLQRGAVGVPALALLRQGLLRLLAASRRLLQRALHGLQLRVKPLHVPRLGPQPRGYLFPAGAGLSQLAPQPLALLAEGLLLLDQDVQA